MLNIVIHLRPWAKNQGFRVFILRIDCVPLTTKLKKNLKAISLFPFNFYKECKCPVAFPGKSYLLSAVYKSDHYVSKFTINLHLMNYAHIFLSVESLFEEGKEIHR